MRKLTLILVLYMLASPLLAQAGEKDTLKSGPVESGGFGGPVLKATTIDDEFGLLVGGRGGWIINHALVIGGGGYGLVNDITVEGSRLKHKLEFGYGGAELEFIIASRRLVHLSVQALIGAGGVGYRNRYFDFDDFNNLNDAFFVAEPGVNLMVNVSRSFRIGFGGSYRFIKGANFRKLDDSTLSGPSVVLTFKFGQF